MWFSMKQTGTSSSLYELIFPFAKFHGRKLIPALILKGRQAALPFLYITCELKMSSTKLCGKCSIVNLLVLVLNWSYMEAKRRLIH